MCTGCAGLTRHEMTCTGCKDIDSPDRVHLFEARFVIYTRVAGLVRTRFVFAWNVVLHVAH